MTKNTPSWWRLGLIAIICPLSASAQIFRCTSGGAAYISDRPCTQVPSKVDKFGVIGPERTSPIHSPSGYTNSPREVRPLDKAPPHQKYLSGACASMADAIRTAPSRGVNYQVIGDLRAEYDQKCREEERTARKQANDDDRLEREKNTAQIYAAQQARSEQARAEAQCQAMREVLASRRANVDRMSPGEKSNFQTLQASFNDRCVKPH